MIVRLQVERGRPRGRSINFGPGEYLLGRGDECHIRFNSEWVSRQHCRLIVKADEATVSDLGSRNGTVVNGQRVTQEQPLRQNDLMQIGPVVFRVHLEWPDGGGPVVTAPSSEIFRASDFAAPTAPTNLISTVKQPDEPPEDPPS